MRIFSHLLVKFGDATVITVIPLTAPGKYLIFWATMSHRRQKMATTNKLIGLYGQCTYIK
jgi:hypothetical protein